MAEIAPLWGNTGAVLKQVRSPFRLAEVLRNAGFLFPETRSSCADLPCDGTWLAKTGRGASGSGVRVHNPKPSPSEDLIYQRRIAGIPYSAVYFASSNGTFLLGIVQQLIGEKWLSARDFQYCGAIGPSPLTKSHNVEIERIGQLIAREFELVGLFGIDLICDGQHVWTIEVNPRYTASVEVIERATGMSTIARAADSSLHKSDSTDPNESALTLYGKAILFAKRSVTISADFSKRMLSSAVQIKWPAIADIPISGSVVAAGRPLLTVFADSVSREQVVNSLQSRVAEIERTLYSD
jgi:predicted ATP-grasp superfamily ATP-dependent carboligase